MASFALSELRWSTVTVLYTPVKKIMELCGRMVHIVVPTRKQTPTPGAYSNDVRLLPSGRLERRHILLVNPSSKEPRNLSRCPFH